MQVRKSQYGKAGVTYLWQKKIVKVLKHAISIYFK